MILLTQYLPDADQNELDFFLSLCTSARRDSLSDAKNKNYAKASLCGEMLAKKGISEMLNIPVYDIDIMKNEKGKPFAYKNGLIIQGVYFSISHSGNYALCALSDRLIGADIEKLKPVKKYVSEKFCTEKEAVYLDGAQNEAEYTKRFFALWTLKESYLKALGTGFSGGLKSVEFDISHSFDSVKSSNSQYDFSINGTVNGYTISICERLDK